MTTIGQRGQTNQVQKEPLRTVSKQYYSGMTRAEAEKGGIFKKRIGIDYKDIDKDKNGVLNDKEICDIRDKEVKRNKVAAGLGMAASGTLGVVGALTSEIGIGIPIFVAGTGGVAMSGAELKDLREEQKITDTYRKEHHLDTKF